MEAGFADQRLTELAILQFDDITIADRMCYLAPSINDERSIILDDFHILLKVMSCLICIGLISLAREISFKLKRNKFNRMMLCKKKRRAKRIIPDYAVVI